MHIFFKLMKRLFEKIKQSVMSFVYASYHIHARGYTYLLGLRPFYSLLLMVTLWLFYVCIVAPFALRVICGLAGGDASFILLEWNIWSTANAILASIITHLRLCGVATACHTSNDVSYAFSFFLHVAENREALTLHGIFSVFITVSIYYFASVFMSLVKRLPQLKPAPSYMLIVTSVVYLFAMYILGFNDLSGGQINRFLLFIMGVFIVLGLVSGFFKDQTLERSARHFILFLFIVWFILYFWPDICLFLNQCYEVFLFEWTNVIAFLRFTYRGVKTLWTLQPKYMWPRPIKTKSSEAEKNEKAAMDDTSPCAKARNERSESIRQAHNRGEITGEKAYDLELSNNDQYKGCKVSSYNSCKHALMEKARQTQLRREEELQEALHERKLKDIRSRNSLDVGGTINKVAETAVNLSEVAKNKSNANQTNANNNQNQNNN